METFYCVGCRASYPAEKTARLSAGVHRDGEPVGFCFVCVRDVQPQSAIADDLEDESDEAMLPEKQVISA